MNARTTARSPHDEGPETAEPCTGREASQWEITRVPRDPRAVEHYARLCAQLAEGHPQASVLEEHGIADDAALRRLHRSFAERFEANPFERDRWQGLLHSYRAWVATGAPRSAPELQPPPPSPPLLPHPPVPADATRVPSTLELEPARARPLAPYPVAAPGTLVAACGEAIPGAPWSATPAALVPQGAVESTLELPPLVGAPAEPRSPELEDTARAALVLDLDLDATTRILAVSPALLAEATPPVVELDAAEGASGASLRAVVARRLAAGEALRDLVLQAADLVGLDFSGADLRGLDLARADLRRCTFVKARLDDACFDDAILTAAVLTRASGARARFVGANLAQAQLERFVGEEATFDRAELTGAELEHARLGRATFAGAVLRDIVATRADLTGATFTDADLRGAVLRQAKLRGAILCGARLDGADLHGTDLSNADVRGAVLQGRSSGQP